MPVSLHGGESSLPRSWAVELPQQVDHYPGPSSPASEPRLRTPFTAHSPLVAVCVRSNVGVATRRVVAATDDVRVRKRYFTFPSDRKRERTLNRSHVVISTTSGSERIVFKPPGSRGSCTTSSVNVWVPKSAHAR